MIRDGYPYEGYFPIPNYCNKDRLRSYLDYMDTEVDISSIKSCHELLDIIDFFPEELLHRAMIDINEYYASIKFKFYLDDDDDKSQVCILKFDQTNYEDLIVIIKDQEGKQNSFCFNSHLIKSNSSILKNFVDKVSKLYIK